MITVSRALSVILLSATLMGCATAREPGTIKTVLLYPPIPYEILRCEAEPSVPEDIEALTQEQFAEWTERIRQAGKDCRRNLDGLRAFIYSWENDVDMMDIWFEEGDDF